MNRKWFNKQFYILALFSLLFTVGMNFSPVAVAQTAETLELDLADCDPGIVTNTTADISVQHYYNGENLGNSVAQGANGTSNDGSLTTYTGSELQIEMLGTASPKQALGTVQAIVTVDGNEVFNETTTDGSNGPEGSFNYTIISLDAPVVVTVISTACDNVTTVQHSTYPAPSNGFDFTCGVNQTVEPGVVAQYPLHAFNMPSAHYYQGIDVTMTSTPDGASMAGSPVGLTWQSDHTGIASVPTAALTQNQAYTLTFAARSTHPGFPGTATCQATLTVTSTALPTANIVCNTGGPGAGTGDCTIPYGSSARIVWTSANTTACTVSPSGWTGVTGDQSTGSLTSTTTYTANCTGPGGSVAGSVTVTVQSPPDFAISCSPAATPIPTGSTTSFDITTTTNTGFNSPVTITEQFNPNTQDLPKVQYSNNGQVPNATTTAEISTDNISPIAYTITFIGTADNGVTHSVDCNLTITLLAPEPPQNVDVSNAGCGVLVISWEPGSKGTGGTPDGYRVYRRNNPIKDWEQLGNNIPETGKPSYEVTDSDPLEPTGSNYYAVSSYNSGGESELVEPNETPIVPTVCEANLSASDKDLIAVQGRVNKTFPVTACSGQSEAVSMPNNSIFSPGDIVTFKINICNTGSNSVTGIRLHDTMTNLTVVNSEEITSTEVNGIPCMRNYVVNDNLREIDFELENIEAAPPTRVCSITFKARVPDVPVEENNILHRFQNLVDLVADDQTANFSTPPYLYGDTDRNPDRGEASPN